MNSYDAVVVGTGFASTFFLKKYLKKVAPSKKVLVLERGYFYSHRDRLKEILGESTVKNPNPKSEETFINPTKKEWVFQPGFGGSSNCWYGCTPRFLPSDFKMKTLYGVASDWPLSYEDLDPYYEEVEDIMSISGPAVTPFPRKKAYPLPPHKFTTVDSILNKQFPEQYIGQATARARVAVNGRGACCASTVCYTCPVDAKFTIENSNIGVYDDPRVEVIYGAQVLSLELSGGVARKVFFMKDGKEQSVAGEIVVLGTNPIFNSHILLNSGDNHSLTGRGVGEQLGLEATAYLDKLECGGGSSWVNANGYMLYDGPHRKEYAACLMEGSNYPFLRMESGKWRNMARFRMIFEDLPLDVNHISTSANKLKPTVHHEQHSPYTLKAVEKMKEKLPGVLSCLPVEKIEYSPFFLSEAHIVGGTRMSNDVKEGVVDKNLVHHNYRNVFVLGSGSFTTYTPANPTLTLSALSMHAADNSF